ncbi:MAG: arginine repressor [Lachnospiraceae bacterium]|nr:arginine repressor [Lachnospiraceae bacterium]
MTEKRRDKIRELITQYAIGTQSALVDRLNAEGFDVTQATVSRDIKALKLIKISDSRGNRRYAMPAAPEGDSPENDLSVFQNALLSMESAGGLVVIRTRSGMAMAIAAVIDRLKLDQVAGCVAGDDTIFVAVRITATPESAARAIRQRME